MTVQPIASYSYDEATGQLVIDATGNGHNHTLTGNLTRAAGGKTGSGLQCSVNTLDPGGPAVFGQTPQRTICLWAYRTSAVTGWAMEWKVTAINSGAWGFLWQNPNVQIRARNASAVSFAQATEPSRNVLHHLAGTYDGTSLRLYIDGVLAAGPVAFAGPLRTDANFLHWFDTLGPETIIDDVRVFDVALDADTIKMWMNTPVMPTTLARVYNFEEGTPAAAVVVGGDYLLVTGTLQYGTVARYDALALRSVNGGFTAVPAPANEHSGSMYVNALSLTAGAARVATFTDSANTFHGMIRMHLSGVFDICDATTTRIAASTATWAAGQWYRIDYQVSGTGTTRTIAVQVFADSGLLIWNSGPVVVTTATANVISRVRLGAQGATTGEVMTDQVRLYTDLRWAGAYREPRRGFGVLL